MGSGLEIAAFAAIGVSGISTVSGYISQSEAAAAQKKANNRQAAMQSEQAAREKRQQIREERIKRAKILQASENTGTVGSAGELGSVAGLSSTLSGNLGFNSSMIEGASYISKQNQAAAGAMQEAKMWDTIGSIANTAVGMTSGSLFSNPAAGSEAAITKGSSTIFGPPQPTLMQKLF